MIDQYIYSRINKTEGKMAGHVGHGLVFYTEGIIPIQKGISDISYYAGEITDQAGKKEEILSKRQIPQSEGKTALYLSKMIEPEKERSFAHCHGYVMAETDAAAINPDLWFYQKFIRENVDEQEIHLASLEELPDRTTPLWPLAKLLERVSLPLEQFVSVVCSCIDAKNMSTAVVISLDFFQEDAWEIKAQLIRWIYHLLPFSMRRQAGFSTCYDNNCLGGDFTVVLVPSSIVKQRGRQIVISSRVKPSSACFVYAMGQRMHSSLSRYQEMGESDRIYVRWLRQVIQTLYEQQEGETFRESLDILDEVYAYFDRLIRSLPEKEQNQEKYLNAVCWTYLCGDQYLNRRLKLSGCDERFLWPEPEEEPIYAKTVLEFPVKDDLRQYIALILGKSLEACRQGTSPFWFDSLCQAKKLGYMQSGIKTIFTIYLACALDRAPAGKGWECWRQLHQTYQEYYGEKDVKRMLEAAFFTEAIDQNFYDYWDEAGVSYQDGNRRVDNLQKERFGQVHKLEDLLTGLDDWLELMQGFSSESSREYMLRHFDLKNTHPKPFKTMSLGIPEFLQICSREQRNIEKYPDIRESLEKLYGDMAMVAYQNSQSKGSGNWMGRIQEWETAFQQQGENLSENPYVQEFWKEELDLVINRVLQAETDFVLDTRLASDQDQDLLSWTGQIIREAQKAGLWQPMLEKFFSRMCRYLLNKAKEGTLVLSKSWYQSFETDSISLERMYQKKEEEAVAIWWILYHFIRSGEYSYETLKKGIDPVVWKYSTPFAGVEKQCLQVLFGMFKKDQLNELGMDILERSYQVLSQIPEESIYHLSRAQYYKRILDMKGGREWLELLKRYPAAPKDFAGRYEEEIEEQTGPQKFLSGLSGFASRFHFGAKQDGKEEYRTEYEERDIRRNQEPTYPWLKTDETLLKTIHELVNQEGFLWKRQDEDPLFVVELIEVIEYLAPEDSSLDKRAIQLKEKIWQRCKKEKLLNAEAQKELKRMKKSGYFG